jgi:type II secretory pathway pseudopilin PulG
MGMHGRLHKAFTSLELAIVIAIVGLLAAVVTPNFAAMRTDAQYAAEQSVAATVRTRVSLAYMQALARGGNAFPAALDDAELGPASDQNPLFTNVMEFGITDGNWTKTAANVYTYRPSGSTYFYTPANGKLTRS